MTGDAASTTDLTSDQMASAPMDISERDEAEEALAFLADAGALLASSLDYETTLASVAQLAVQRIADWCAIHLVDPDGEVRQVAVTHPDPAKIALAHQLEERYPYDPDAAAGVPQVLRTGEPELIVEITDDLIEQLSPDAELVELVRELGLTSSMVVPLSARDRTLGAITFVAAESGRHFDVSDLALAQELARRAGLAVDNARLYGEAQRVAAERSAILSQMLDGVIICDSAGMVTFMNDAACRLYGTDFRGSGLVEYQEEADILVDGDGHPYTSEALPMRRALFDGELTVAAEARLRRPDGTELVIQRSATPVKAEDGTVLGAVMTVRDVTAQRDLDRMKDEFLGSMAHDLKTPLTSMKGLSQVLHRRVAHGAVDDQSRLLQGLERIDQSATRMTHLVDQLLDVTRMQMGRALDLNPSETDLIALVREQMTDVAETSSSHQFRLETDLPVLVGHWDADRLQRVFSNLLANAVKYSPEGGEIVVEVTRTDGEERSWAVVSIRDSGLGIPAEDLPRIFERFHRGSNVAGTIQGAGIGLAGVKHIVEEHGGTIDVVSVEGAGSTFTIRLPVTEAEEA